MQLAKGYVTQQTTEKRTVWASQANDCHVFFFRVGCKMDDVSKKTFADDGQQRGVHEP
jgi:hypothetical protein